ncbi:MAG: lipase family protein [Synergistaceae bacterium]|nr:lipase family protein [Synergistaceae bacterium]
MKEKKKFVLSALSLLLFAAVVVSGGCGGGGESGVEAGDIASFEELEMMTSADLASSDAEVRRKLNEMLVTEGYTISGDQVLSGDTVVLDYSAVSEDNAAGGAIAGASDPKKGLPWMAGKLSKFTWDAHWSGYDWRGLSGVKMKYWTSNQSGSLVVADAAVFIPHTFSSTTAPILAIQHPTEVMRKNSPSKLVRDGRWPYDPTDPAQVQMLLCELAARCGYIVVIADYLGMGENMDIHPYCQELLAKNVADAIDAVKDLKINSGNPVTWDQKKILLMGFSEGAYATMSAAKELQANYAKDLPMTAVACLDGPYSLTGAMRELMLYADDKFIAPFFLPYVLNGYSAAYGSTIPELDFRYAVRNDLSGYKDYPARLQQYMDGSYSGDQINDLIKSPFLPDNYTGPSVILTTSFRSLLESMVENPVTSTLAKNNSFAGWSPAVPLRMFHNVSDDIVPYANLTEAKAAFDAAGSVRVTTEPFEEYVDSSEVGDCIHEQAYIPAFMRGFYWLDSYAYGNRFTPYSPD